MFGGDYEVMVVLVEYFGEILMFDEECCDVFGDDFMDEDYDNVDKEV